MSDLVTVLMPVYNAGAQLKKAIKSILSQTYSNIEFLIINDGSTDDSAELINSFNDDRIVFIDNVKNKGLARTLNEGLLLAKGKYIARMDHDDIAYSDRIEKQVAYMLEHPDVDICGCWIKLFGALDKVREYKVTNDDIIADLLENSALPHPGVLFKKELVAKGIYKYNPDFDIAEDYELWTRLAYDVVFYNLPEVLLDYRITEGQISTKYKKEQIDLTDRIKTNYFFKYLSHESKYFYDFFKQGAKAENIFVYYRVFNEFIVFCLSKNIPINVIKKYCCIIAENNTELGPGVWLRYIFSRYKHNKANRYKGLFEKAFLFKSFN